jgi:putative DNA primase/helicase
MSVGAFVARFGLRRSAHDEWRGDCPHCGYEKSFTLTEVEDDRAIGWCAACQDVNAVNALVAESWPARQSWSSSRAKYNSVISAATLRQGQMRKDAALRLWEASVPARGTIADNYLRGRGLDKLAASSALRFHAHCPHPNGGTYPAMVALVQDVAGWSVGIHRTFLEWRGKGKAGNPPRASLGPIWGGAIRLDPEGPMMTIGEGIESSASAGVLLERPAWAAISQGNLERGVQLPAEVQDIIVASDNDAAGIGQNAARGAQRRWLDEGRNARCATPNTMGEDFNDVLVQWLYAIKKQGLG